MISTDCKLLEVVVATFSSFTCWSQDCFGFVVAGSICSCLFKMNRIIEYDPVCRTKGWTYIAQT